MGMQDIHGIIRMLPMTFCMLSCSGKSDNAQTGISEHMGEEMVTETAVPVEKGKLEVEDAMPLTVRPTGDPEKDWIFVEQGGMVTADRDFEVDLNCEGSNGNPFFVKEVR